MNNDFVIEIYPYTTLDSLLVVNQGSTRNQMTIWSPRKKIALISLKLFKYIFSHCPGFYNCRWNFHRESQFSVYYIENPLDKNA